MYNECAPRGFVLQEVPPAFVRTKARVSSVSILPKKNDTATVISLNESKNTEMSSDATLTVRLVPTDLEPFQLAPVSSPVIQVQSSTAA